MRTPWKSSAVTNGRHKALSGLIRPIISSPTAFTGFIIILFWALMAFFASAIVPYHPTTFHIEAMFQPPSINHFFGTDQFGRDVFSRVLVGSRDVLILAPLATLLGLVIGVFIGLVTGYFGGYIDEIIMRIMDALLSFPTLLLAMVVMGVLGQSVINVILVIGVVFSPRIARVTRSAVLEVKPLEYIQAARIRGESSLYIMAAEILPNITSPLSVEASIRFAYAIFTAASLNFLGLGVPPPSPDWGLMVSEGREYMLVAPWVVIFPALCIASLVVGANLFFDRIREILLGEKIFSNNNGVI